jgi:hypothetical protein
LAREEQEAWEKKTGILVGLGQSSTEATGLLPFYTRPRQSLDAVEYVLRNAQPCEDDVALMLACSYHTISISEKARRRKDALDPLHDLSKYLVEKERGGVCER